MPEQIVKSGGKIYDQQNVANGATTYVYLGLLAHAKQHWSMHWLLSNVTLTIEVTNERPTATTTGDVDINNATAAQLTALNWRDVTQARTGNATETTDGSYAQDFTETYFLARIKLVTTNATNSAKLFFNSSANL